MNGIIFDLDGVIVNTAQYHYLGWKRLADNLGIAFDEKKNEKLKGLSRRDSLLALLGETPAEERIEKLCSLKNGYYLELIKGINESDILPGARELLRALRKSRRWKRALASSSRNARSVVAALKLEKFFDAVVDGSEVERAKPDPALFLKAAQKLGIAPESCVVVEDAGAGILSARRAGMRTVGIGRKEDLPDAGWVVPDLSRVTPADLENRFFKRGWTDEETA